MSNEAILDNNMKNIEGIEAELNKVPEEIQTTFNEDPIEILVEEGEIENVQEEDE